MTAAQDGDAEAYRNLLIEVAGVLRSAIRARRKWIHPEGVEDLVQDVLLSLHAARATYDPRRPFMPWLMAIAQYRMADAARARIRRTSHEVESDRDPETFAVAKTNMPDDRIVDRAALHDAMRGLSGGQRTAVEMLKLQGMSLVEASAASGMSVGALKVAVHRGLRRLRQVLTKES